MTHATTLAPAAASTRLSPGALHRRLWQCAVGSDARLASTLALSTPFSSASSVA